MIWFRVSETFDQSDEKTWPDQQKDKDNDDNDDHEDKEDNGTEHPEIVILEICDLWETDHSSDHNIHSDPSISQ